MAAAQILLESNFAHIDFDALNANIPKKILMVILGFINLGHPF